MTCSDMNRVDEVPALDTVVFDLDGTLVDTAPDLIAALNFALVATGYPAADPEAVRPLCGDGAAAMLGHSLPHEVDADVIDTALRHFLDHYGENLCRSSKPYDGSEACLENLRRAGLGLAICTNKPLHLARGLIDGLGWGSLFDAVIGGDTLAARKPGPEPLLKAIARCGGRSACFVGDSEVDARCARTAGVPFVAVDFGYGNAAARMARGQVLTSYEQVGAAIEGWGCVYAK